MWYRVKFANGKEVDLDLTAFGLCGMGDVLDHLAVKHGGIIGLELKG